MSALLRKFFIPIFLLIITLFTPTTISAQQNITTESANASASAQMLQQSAESITNPISPIYMNQIFYNVVHTFSCVIEGKSIIGLPCLEYLSVKDSNNQSAIVPVLTQNNLSGGALGVMGRTMGMLYTNMPLRTADYIADMNFIDKADAQVAGAGNIVLSPIYPLWETSRNIAYVALIIVFVLVGVMVMLRNKVNPQTVISIQFALPGLILGLVMITLSYFLAALITDLAFLGINLVGAYFSLAQKIGIQDLGTNLAGENVLSIFGRFVGTGSTALFSEISQTIFNNLGEAASRLVSLLLAMISYQFAYSIGSGIGTLGATIVCSGTGAIAVAPFCTAIGQAAGGTIAGGAAAIYAYNYPANTLGFIIYFVLIAVVLYSMFMLLFRLINNYLAIIFYTITAPFYFLIAALPGRQDVATDWMRNMLCNVLSFPAVLAVLYFVAYLLGANTVQNLPFAVPSNSINFSGGGALPLMGGLNLDFIRYMLAYGALVATPAIPEIVCRAVGKVGPAGQLIGNEISGARRSGQQYLNQTQGGLSKLYTGIAGPIQGVSPGVMEEVRKRLGDRGWGGLLRKE